MEQRFYESQIMICVICRQAEIVDGLTIVRFEHDEFRLLVKSVPAQVCPSCGEAYLEEAIAEQLLQIARQKSEAGILNTQCEYDAL
jgi:YgiT-type zinc finger domain-containing protein